mmetsp:Transcript_37091/g.75650  ORF Transcript_37091/g.75650 Transcript_37091/m.75650 type:complete len:232 (-) Transcript_37091:266-961(-)
MNSAANICGVDPLLVFAPFNASGLLGNAIEGLISFIIAKPVVSLYPVPVGANVGVMDGLIVGALVCTTVFRFSPPSSPLPPPPPNCIPNQTATPMTPNVKTQIPYFSHLLNPPHCPVSCKSANFGFTFCLSFSRSASAARRGSTAASMSAREGGGLFRTSPPPLVNRGCPSVLLSELEEPDGEDDGFFFFLFFLLLLALSPDDFFLDDDPYAFPYSSSSMPSSNFSSSSSS